ncbi:MAG: FAD-binding protein [Thermocrispum sp.]
MSLELPDLVRAADVGAWSDEVDVLVVGFGIAGSCAAVAAADAGARVLVIDRGGQGSCTTALAGGHFYLGGGTPVQQATGHHDTPEAMYAYLHAVSPEPDEAKLRLYCDGSVEHFGWLERQGVPFERSYYPGKAVIQPGTEGLMYTGNELVWPFRGVAEPAPRGHKVAVAGDTGGASLVVELMAKRLASESVEVRYETGATALVVDGRRVAGAAWRRFGDTGFVRARTVVLAAGGFVMNEQMVAEFVPQLTTAAYPLGTTYDDGLGIRLGQSAGGAVRRMGGAFYSSPFYPPAELLQGIIVNADGERFVAEDSYHGRTADAVFGQPGNTAFLVLDSESMATPKYGLTTLIDGWESVAGMAAALGTPELERTLQRYNAEAARGEDSQLHKHPAWLKPLNVGPWGAYDLTPGRASYVGFTLGGLRTSVDGEVLDDGGSPVAGLYAAGACASNIAQDSSGYASGTQLGEGSYFGRRVGEHAARG